MIVIKLHGGIGNQMFQYAYGYALAKRYNQNLVLDKHFYSKDNLRSYKLDAFNISYNEECNFAKLPLLIKIFESNYINKLLRILKINKIKINRFIYYLQVSPHYNHGDDDFGNFENLYISGYWQNPKHFECYENEIKDQFLPKYEFSEQTSEIIQDIENCSSVALHVRRGDYLLPENQRYNVNDDYFYKAIDIIRKKYSDTTLYTFSDDCEWVKQKFSDISNIKFIHIGGIYGDIDEMLCMTHCKHNINANSSFSWWGAWLNKNAEKIVINPDRYWSREMIPSSWTVIDNVEVK